LIGLKGRLAARRNAPIHVHLELVKFSARPRMPSEVQIEGMVVRVFRGDASLQPELLYCFPHGSARGETSLPAAYVYYKDLVAASHMEVYLYGTPPHCNIAVYEYVLLNGPSLDARMSVEELEDLMELSAGAPQPLRQTKKWWQIGGR
jgi:hypothetical protein